MLCTEHEATASSRRGATRCTSRVPADAPGVSVVGDWDPLGMRGTVSRTLLFKDVFVPDDAALMPRGVYFQAATRWPHMFMTLSPTYMGIAQAAYDFTVQYLRGEMPGHAAGQAPHVPDQADRGRRRCASCWSRPRRSGSRPSPRRGSTRRKEQCCAPTPRSTRSWRTPTRSPQLAIRTCGGQSMLKTLPLERLYRDSRCGSLMLPWTAELCLDRIGREALYEPGETDE